MTPSQTVAESMFIELAEKSFNTFCDDISGMFGIDIQGSLQQATTENVKGLQVRLKDLVALFSVNAEGTLDGSFKLVLDQQGLFILAGVVAMHPEQIILENANSASLENAQKEISILKEVGAALAGSWERIFRKGLDDHVRFVQTDTFIGNPWKNPQENIELTTNEQVSFVQYDMTVGSFPAFKCGIIFKKEFLAGAPQTDSEKNVSNEKNAREENENKTQEETENKTPNASEEMQESQDAAQENTEGTAEPEGSAVADQAQPGPEETVAPDESAAKQEPEAAAEQKPNDLEQKPTATNEADKQQDRPISDAIKKMTQSSAVSSDESKPSTTQEKPALSSKDVPLVLYAKDIMQKNVIWANPDDSVQQALTKIQQNDAGYLIIGRGQVPEGIVSKSDLNGTLSPYLKPAFAKWRRPLDDATLQIKIKWIMGKPINTIQPDTPLTAIMDKMCQNRIRCLPVVDEQGKVLGLITVFDIFKVFLNQPSNS